MKAPRKQQSRRCSLQRQQPSAGLFLSRKRQQTVQTVRAVLFQSRPTVAVPLPDTRGCRGARVNFTIAFKRVKCCFADRRIDLTISKVQGRLFIITLVCFSFLPPYFSGVLRTSVCDTMVTRLLFSILILLQTQLPTQRTIKNNNLT